jgi:hypothetical protein
MTDEEDASGEVRIDQSRDGRADRVDVGRRVIVASRPASNPARAMTVIVRVTRPE